MQKQLVLAALFATAQAGTCADANTAIADAALAANTAAKVGLDATKVIADKAKKTASDAWDKAVVDEGKWTLALSGFVAEQLAATNAFKSTKSTMEGKKATLNALQIVGEAADSTANKLLPVYLTSTAAATANTKATATSDPSLIFSDEAAKTILTFMKKNLKEHLDLKTAAFNARATALTNWDTKNNLAESTVLTAAATLKFSKGAIAIRKVSAAVATGAYEDMRKCSSNGIGKSTANAAAVVWDSGSHNQVAGLAATGGALNAAAEYQAQYMDCSSGGIKGYTATVTANKLLSAGSGTTYTNWLAAQKLLETRGYLFGKLRHVCMNSTRYAAAATPLMPCTRSDQFEKTYKNQYPGDQADQAGKGTEDAQWPVTASTAGATGKLGDFAADSTYTKSGSVVEYVAPVTKTKAGVVATSLYLDRDNKYGLWLAVVKTTAGHIVTENKAKLVKATLTLLATVYTTPQSTVNASSGRYTTMAIAGTQALLVQTAFNTKDDAKLAVGVASDQLASSPAAAAKMAKGTMTTLADKFNKENVAFTDLKKAAILSNATLLTKLYFEASIAYHNSNTKWVAATADEGRAVTAQALTAKALKKAKTDSTIATYLSNIQADALTKATAEYNVANTLYQRMLATKTTSEENNQGGESTKAHNNDLSNAAYADVTAQALTAKTAAAKAAKNADDAIQKNADFAKSQALVITAAVNNCKAVGYALAQSTLKEITVADVADAALAAKVSAAYLIKSNAARPASADTASVEGSSCAFGPVTDGTPKPRPVCAEKLCCGAANKFLRDGTKLTVETCQKETAISYTFYPNIKKGATVAPTAEQWRFSCISGAKNLAATATAALAAAYLMA